jgi:HSP90 family molecular chaperone
VPSHRLSSTSQILAHNNKDLMPDWTRFLFGIIDTDDLQLNVSREILQQDKTLKKISQSLTKKVIDFLYELLNNHREKYITFYNTYSKFLKVGLYNDSKLKLRLQDLILFKHINNPYEYVSLKSYSDNLNNLKSLNETTVNDTTVSNTTVSNTTVNDTTVNETTVNDKTVSNQTVNDTTVSNQTVNDTTVNDTTVNDTTVNDKTVNEQKEKTQEEMDREKLNEIKYNLIYYIFGDYL